MAAEPTLRSLIDAGRNSKRLDELSSARVVGKIALQIHAAQQKAGHGKSVGPIAPQAIKIAETGEATLALSDSPALGYSAPEQLDGSGDRRSDVFSLGTVLWEVLTHQRLFDAMNDAAVRAAVTERPITPPSELNANVPAELSAICMRALSRNPTDRYQSLKAMAVEIEEFLSEAGYEDNDDKIAQYLKTGGQQPSKQVKIELPNRTKSPSGIELAAKLAGATPTTTPMGFAAAPAPEDWRDKSPQTPLPPVLPDAAQTRNDKSTISVAVPPQVKVPTSSVVVEAMHTEAKPAALIVDEEPPRVAKPATQPQVFISKTETAQGVGGTMRLPADLIPPHAPEQPKILEAPPVTIAVAKPADERPRIETAETRPVEALAPTTNGAAHIGPDMLATQKIDVGDIPGATVEPASSTRITDPEAPKPSLEIIEEPKFLATPAATTPAVEAIEPLKVEAPKVEVSSEVLPRAASQPIVPARAASHSDTTKAAGIVSLPNRESKPDVLAGWGWGTDRHALVPDGYPLEDSDYDDKPQSNRKTLMYVIGGGLAFALVITIIAFAAGGSKKTEKKEQAKPVAAQQLPEPPPPPEDLTPRAGSDVAAGSAVDAEQAAKAQAEKEQADKLAAEQAAKAQAEKEQADKLAAEQAAKEQAAKEKADKLAAEKAAKADNLAAEKAAREQAATDKAAKLAADKATRDKTKPTTTLRPKTTLDPKPDKTVAKVEPPPPTTTKHTDPEVPYRQGLQAFARGDTTAALASLRQSLAVNKNYAPTWRGLGLVFEKMGEKDQARNAYKRYLELVPNAGDVEIIKGRLERLGP